MSTSLDETTLWDLFSQAVSLNEGQEQRDPPSHDECQALNQKSNQCKNCDADEDCIQLDTASGQVVCTECGFVTESSYIDPGAEWNNYTDDMGGRTSGERCGGALDPTNPFDTVGTMAPNLRTRVTLPDGRTIVKNLKNTYIRTHYTSKQRAFNEGKYAFDQIVHQYGLPESVLINAKMFWGIILKTDILTRGGNRRGLKACCLYYAATSVRSPRARDEIISMFDLTDSKDFSKGDKIFREIFDKNEKYSWILYQNTKSEDMFGHYVSKLGLDFSVTKKMYIINEHCSQHLLGVNTKSKIAGIIYYVTNRVFNLKKPNKTTVATTVGVCNPTLNKVIEIIAFFYTKNPELKDKLNK